MNTINLMLAAWLEVLSSHGCEISHFMNQGSEAKIAEIEESIGYKFTDDLKSLYHWADDPQEQRSREKMRIVHYDDGGADAVYDVDPSPGKYFCPLFGNYMMECW